MAIEAVIMAGGEGVRLRPMTMDKPKPLMPLLGRPVMGYALELLSRHNVTRAAATLCYMPGAVKAAFGHISSGIRLSYFEEKTTLGTAGSVKAAMTDAADTFFVLSGDGLTDADLSAALRFHQERGALATLVLKRCACPLPYGVVLAGDDGRITRFIEKPTWSRVFSDLVNTGIYILEKDALSEIPSCGAPDFGRDIFPALLKKGAPLYGFETDGYWCDIGSEQAYLSAQSALMEGRVSLPLPTRIADDAFISPNAAVDGLSYVLSGARVMPGAAVEKSVIGEAAFVSERAEVSSSCMMRRSFLGERAVMENSVLCEGANALSDTHLSGGAALGACARLNKGARLLPGASVWPGLTVPEDTDVSGRMVTGGDSPVAPISGGLCVPFPAHMCRAATALSGYSPKWLLCGALDEPMMMVLCGALMNQGGHVLLCHGPLVLCQTLAQKDGVPGAYISGETLLLFDSSGRPLQDAVLLKLSGEARREDAPLRTPGRLENILDGEARYLSLLPERKPSALNVFVASRDPALRGLIEKAFPCGDSKAPRVILSGGGTRYALARQNKRLPCETTAMLCAVLVHEGGAVHADASLPLAMRALMTVLPFDDSRASLRQYLAFHDGLYFARVLENALEKASFDELLATLPRACVVRRNVPCAQNARSRVLGRLMSGMRNAELSEGLSVHMNEGDVLILPDAARPVIHVAAEAARMETADELCAVYEQKVREKSQ